MGIKVKVFCDVEPFTSVEKQRYLRKILLQIQGKKS
jgi:hypothetical protein